ncbi:MAG: TIGR03086 family metal-binding protein [Acidimicrobiia bacterium]
MELSEAYAQALGEFDQRVQKVGADQWDAPTPCTDWTVRNLVNHVTGQQLVVPRLIKGEKPNDIVDLLDGDVLGNDAAGVWGAAAADAKAAFAQAGVLDKEIESMAGALPVADYAWELALGLTVHAWDLARAIGADEKLNEDLVRTIFEKTRPQLELWRRAGLTGFDDAVPVADDADVQTRLIALVGRKP